MGGILFGSLGVGYFIYGKKQGKIAYLVCGAALAIYTFVVSSTLLVVVIGLLLSAGPWLIGRFFYHTSFYPVCVPVRVDLSNRGGYSRRRSEAKPHRSF